ncbi:MAG: hypothetical protein NVS1B10_02550 [Candidatus Saccharimonadales bacterium]
MKKISHFIPFLALLILLILIFPSGSVSAHILKASNGIAGTIHIPPDDNPMPNQITELQIAFSDKTGAFSLADCNCKVSVRDDNHVIQTVIPKPSLAGATLDSTSKVTFPRAGVYTILANGNSKDGKFSNFQLEYKIRVESGVVAASTDNKGSTALWIAAGTGAASLLALAYINLFRNRRTGTSNQIDNLDNRLSQITR